MILPEINQKMPIYRDCTLLEVMVVSFACIVTLMLLLVPTTIICFGYGWIGAVLALVLWVHTSKFFLARLQKLKFGKPYGYYQHVLLKTLSGSTFASWLPIPFVQRCGKWSVRRKY
jgi:conjugative transfer region protein (TIGR03750 family)